MNNLKVSLKLRLSFLSVILVTVLAGWAGISGIVNVNNNSLDMYYNRMVPVPYILTSEVMIKQQMANAYRMYVYSLEGNLDSVGSAFADIQSHTPVIAENVSFYRSGVRDANSLAMIDEATDLHANVFLPAIRQVYDAVNRPNPDRQAATAALGTAWNASETMRTNYRQVIEIRLTNTARSVEAASSDAQRQVAVTVVLFALAIAVAVVLSLVLSRAISRPLIALTNFMQKAGTTGDITLQPVDVATIGKYAGYKDEIGVCVGATASFVKHITYVSGELEQVAGGDLTIQVHPLSDKDVLGNALSKVVADVSGMLSEMRAASDQVSSGSAQIANGAQGLAQGSTEQAATVEELSASTAEIAEKTKDNAQMAGKAADLAGTIKGNAEKGSRQMGEMVAAVNEISQASQSIGKVIKVIDDIAFQTNILALNAAVEAARAGQHGKGFAVVADEVRTLAAKSAEAAKDTSALISNSIEKAEYGASIAQETAESLVEIVEGINQSSEIIREIAAASETQSIGISQINSGIDQVATVVQQNSATAEESAAAAEELSGQSALLESLIAQFKLKGGQGRGVSAAKKQPAVYGGETSFALGVGDKY